METQTSIRHAMNSTMVYEKCLTFKFANKPIKPWFYKHIRDQRKLSKTEIMFGEHLDNNINGKLTLKREAYTIACLSTTRKQVLSNQINEK